MSETLDQFETGLQVSERMRTFLLETTKWCKFLAIMGFIGLGFMVLGSLFVFIAGASMPMRGTGAPMGIIGVVYLIVAALYFFPTYYLFKFAVDAKKGIQNASQADLDSGFENLKSTFKFMGILTIVVLGLYALMLLVVVIAAAARF